MHSDLDRIREGEKTKFNSSQATLERIDLLIRDINQTARIRSPDGVLAWFETLRVIDREISSFLSEKELAELNGVRVRDLPNRADFIMTVGRNKLDTYDRMLRYFIHKKGLGMIAGQDLSQVILGNA